MVANKRLSFQPSDYVGSTPKTQDAITCGILVVGIFPKQKGFPKPKNVSCHPGGDEIIRILAGGGVDPTYTVYSFLLTSGGSVENSEFYGIFVAYSCGSKIKLSCRCCRCLD